MTTMISVVVLMIFSLPFGTLSRLVLRPPPEKRIFYRGARV